MNILVVSQSGDILGGANRSLIDVIFRLKKEYGHTIQVVLPSDGRMSKELSEIGIDYTIINYRQTSFLRLMDGRDFLRTIRTVSYLFENMVSAWRYSKLIRNNKPDVIYINDTTNTFGFYLSRFLRLPYVWHFRGYDPQIKRYLLNEKNFCNDDKGSIIVISNAMKDYMTNIRGIDTKKQTVVYNGLSNPYEVSELKFQRKIDKEIHCLHCGHISPAKGAMQSLQAIIELDRRGWKNIFLHYAGSPANVNGVMYDELLKKIAKENGVADRIIFEGEVSNMKKLRDSMTIELMCSVAEPFGRVTVEGMQAGLVVIGSDTGATPEIISDGMNGLLYEQGNPKSLASCIEKVIISPDLYKRISCNARLFTKDHFTIEENVRQINNVLTKYK